MCSAPDRDHRVGIGERHEDGRADREPPPLHDPLVELGHRVPHPFLTGQLTDRVGQPLDLLAQLERGGQAVLHRAALAPDVVAHPGLAVELAPVRQRLASTGKVIECAPLGRLADLLIYP
jgi:hypothetical protein